MRRSRCLPHMRWVLALATAVASVGSAQAQAQPGDWGVKRDAGDAATKKHALEWVAHLAEETQDLVKLNWAYDELIKLEPKDGKHWVDRGLSMQKLNHYADAIDNFAKAEALMQTDPQGKLDVIV